MTFTDIFIRRPVLATVVSLLIVIAGVQAIVNLNVRQYPRTENAVVTVTTVYVGANADLVRGASVIVPSATLPPVTEPLANSFVPTLLAPKVAAGEIINAEEIAAIARIIATIPIPKAILFDVPGTDGCFFFSCRG